MQQRLNKKTGFAIFILFFLILVAPRLLAAEYSRTYRFERPEIITLANGRHLLDLTGTRLKDDIVGAPILPVKTARIFIPPEEEVVSVDIDYGTSIIIEGSYAIQHVTTPHPLSFEGHIAVDQPDPAIYATNTSYPSHTLGSRKRQFLHGVKIVLVELMPVSYNPLEGQLTYYEMLKVRIGTEIQKRPDGVMPFKNSNKDRNRILNAIENKDDFLMRHPASEHDMAASSFPVDKGDAQAASTRQYVVITTGELAPAFQTLTRHRASSAGGGYTTHIEYIEDIDASYTGVDLAEKMRNFIRDMYIDHGTRYVLLGGDSDGSPEKQVIPTRGCYARVGDRTDNTIPSDLYFGNLDGSWNSDGDELWCELNDGVDGGDIDWFSEVYVGRIPADDYAEAMNQINKIIAFESGYGSDKTLLAGEALEDDTWGGDRMDWVYSHMGSTPKIELYDRDWGNNNWPSSQLLTYINSDNYYWVNHSGHSTVNYNLGMYSHDVFSMTNNHFLFVYSQGCYSGSIDSLYPGSTYGSVDSFGEVITNDHSDGGAFAYIGNSRYGWYHPGSYVKGASNRVHKEFVEAVFTDNITKIGEANQKSKTDLPLDSGLYRWIAFETNLLGCPATELVAQSPPDEGGGSGGGGPGCFIGAL